MRASDSAQVPGVKIYCNVETVNYVLFHCKNPLYIDVNEKHLH